MRVEGLRLRFETRLNFHECFGVSFDAFGVSSYTQTALDKFHWLFLSKSSKNAVIMKQVTGFALAAGGEGFEVPWGSWWVHDLEVDQYLLREDGQSKRSTSDRGLKHDRAVTSLFLGMQKLWVCTFQGVEQKVTSARSMFRPCTAFTDAL